MISDERKSKIVSDNTIQAERLGDFLKNLGEKGINVSKRMAENVLSNPGRALDSTAKLAFLFLKNLNKLYQHYQS